MNNNSFPTHLKVTVKNIAPQAGGVITPLWLSAHNGSFDTFNVGESASKGTENLAEEGIHGLEGANTGLIDTLTNEFGLDLNDVPPQSETIAGEFSNSDAFEAGGVQGVVQANPLGFNPGESSSTLIKLGDNPIEENGYLSFGAMFIPSNDAFIGNENPQSIPLFNDEGDFLGGNFIVSGDQVWDAGTEVNDEDFNNIPFTLDLVGNGVPETNVVRQHPGLLPAGSGGVLDFPNNGSDPIFSMADFQTPGSELLQVSVEAISVDPPLEFRTIDGTGNSQLDLGSTNEQLVRQFTPAFEDGIDIPRGGSFEASDLPNPRQISNTIFSQAGDVPNSLGVSDWLWQWGQFVDHDLSLNEANDEFPPLPTDFTPITIPNGDSVFADETTIPFIRVSAAEGTGEGTDRPRQTINQISSFIDGSGVYGSSEERADFLRTFSNGQLKISDSNNAETLLPLNLEGEEALPNATGGTLGEFQYIAGDIRANEQTGLIAVHTLFVREHNRIANELYERLENQEESIIERFDAFRATQQTTLNDALKDEFIYESTRRVVSAQIQQITYEEFLPLLIGEDTLEEYSGYNATVIPSVSAEFANAAYRLGHTLLSNQIQRLDENGLDPISLSDSFFNPEDVQAKGVDSTLRGLILQESQELDNQAVDGIRNFLFPAGTGGLDLPAINIARGRETGLPGYVEIYNQLFPERAINSFDDLPFREGLGGTDGLFSQAYETVEQIDLFVGGISELPSPESGLLGPTFSAIIADQFSRVRDGDRFFYLDDLPELTELYPEFENSTLSEILRNNTQYDALITENAFEVPYNNSIVGDDTNDRLNSSSEADLIDGGPGDDVLRGRNGADFLLGEAGNDTILGGQENDTILGGIDNDSLHGNRGDDVLLGGHGNDILRGGKGDDRFIGGDGNNFVVGGNGDDYLSGTGDGFGAVDRDTLVGGSGRDTFALSEDDTLFYKGSGFATIRRFDSLQDSVQLLGSASDYTLNQTKRTTQLSTTESDDLIAVFVGSEPVSNLDSGFTFI